MDVSIPSDDLEEHAVERYIIPKVLIRIFRARLIVFCISAGVPLTLPFFPRMHLRGTLSNSGMDPFEVPPWSTKVQVQLPHRLGGMGLRRLSKDAATAARLSSAALAHAALAGGSDKALPFRCAMGLEAHSSLARLQEAWPTVKGLADRPDDAAEWSGRKPDGKALRMAALQRAMS